MEDNIQVFLVSSLSVFVFIMALVLFFSIHQNAVNMNVALEDTLNSGKTLFESEGEGTDTYVTGAQIICSIHTGLESDIEVDHMLIDRTVDSNSFDYTQIDQLSNYTSMKSINGLGKIEKIVYIKR